MLLDHVISVKISEATTQEDWDEQSTNGFLHFLTSGQLPVLCCMYTLLCCHLDWWSINHLDWSSIRRHFALCLSVVLCPLTVSMLTPVESFCHQACIVLLCGCLKLCNLLKTFPEMLSVSTLADACSQKLSFCLKSLFVYEQFIFSHSPLTQPLKK